VLSLCEPERDFVVEGVCVRVRVGVHDWVAVIELVPDSVETGVPVCVPDVEGEVEEVMVCVPERLAVDVCVRVWEEV